MGLEIKNIPSSPVYHIWRKYYGMYASKATNRKMGFCPQFVRNSVCDLVQVLLSPLNLSFIPHSSLDQEISRTIVRNQLNDCRLSGGQEEIQKSKVYQEYAICSVRENKGGPGLLVLVFFVS